MLVKHENGMLTNNRGREVGHNHFSPFRFRSPVMKPHGTDRPTPPTGRVRRTASSPERGVFGMVDQAQPRPGLISTEPRSVHSPARLAPRGVSHFRSDHMLIIFALIAAATVITMQACGLWVDTRR